MARTWDEQGQLGDAIADRQRKRAMDAQREQRDHHFKQEQKRYWDSEYSKQRRNTSNK